MIDLTRIADNIDNLLKKLEESGEHEKNLVSVISCPYTFSEVIEKIAESIQLGFKNRKFSDQDGPYVEHMYDQLSSLHYHLTLETCYGKYQYGPCVAFLKKARDFIDIVNDDNPFIDNKWSKLPSQDNPSDRIERMRTLKKEEQKAINSLVNNPHSIYKEYRERLEKDGVEAKFPEFAKVVEYLLLQSLDDDLLLDCDKDKHLSIARKKAVERLQEVMEKGFPYLESLEAIENYVSFLDVHERGKEGGKQTPYYHTARWRYQSDWLKTQIPEHIIIPSIANSSIANLGVSHLIKIRGVPIGFAGVSEEPIYVDGHWQTPLEFYVHDLNHDRRQYQQLRKIALERNTDPNVSDEDKVKAFIEECCNFICNVLHPLLPTKDLDVEEANIRNLMKAIVFEIIHEEALPAHPDVILEALLRRPFESTKYFLNEKHVDGKVQYSLDPAATILCFVYWKLAGDFYDTPGMRIAGLGAEEFRERGFIAQAAIELLENMKIPNIEKLKEIVVAQAQDDSGLPQTFRAGVRKKLELQGKDPDEELKEIAAGGELGFNEGAKASTALLDDAPPKELSVRKMKERLNNIQETLAR